MNCPGFFTVSQYTFWDNIVFDEKSKFKSFSALQVIHSVPVFKLGHTLTLFYMAYLKERFSAKNQKRIVSSCLAWQISFVIASLIGYHSWKLLEIWNLENVRLFVRFRGASDFDQDVKLSGRVCLNLEFFEKIIKFMKKMND